ncbi:hypothetical protein BJ741DRAFT_665571 [Chytriomyces cf. hyalinus JEL632]|nr:hypothetical protein BJ741DRAFT_665571 [Chytriomyces cf. hyalinus JEL632]
MENSRQSRASSVLPRAAGATRDSSMNRTSSAHVPSMNTNNPNASTANTRASVASTSTIPRAPPIQRISSQASSVLVSVTSAAGQDMWLSDFDPLANGDANLFSWTEKYDQLQNVASQNEPFASRALFDLGSANDMDDDQLSNMFPTITRKSSIHNQYSPSTAPDNIFNDASMPPLPKDAASVLNPLVHSKSATSQISKLSSTGTGTNVVQRPSSAPKSLSIHGHSRQTTPGSASTAGTSKNSEHTAKKGACSLKEGFGVPNDLRLLSNATLGSATMWKLDDGMDGGQVGPNAKILADRLARMKLWTRQTPLPTIYETGKEWRFILRLLQFALTFGLSVGTFRANYMSSVLSTSGINFMAFTAISSAFVSFAWVLVYMNPSNLGIPPHKHPRISRVELVIDMYFIAMWLAASVNLASHAYIACPQIGSESCVTWDLCLLFGYACVAAFAGMVCVGVLDLREHGWGCGSGAVRSVEARGGWLQAAMVKKLKDGVEQLVDEFED